MRSEARTVDEYLASLPEDRRDSITTVRDIIVENLPEGVDEVMNWGMITYEIPLSMYPDTYNGKPLMYAALASQKNHMAVYLTAVYMSEERREAFEEQYRASGKPFDVGKSCVRFRKLHNLPLPLIGEVIGSMTLDQFIEEVKKTTSVRKAKK